MEVANFCAAMDTLIDQDAVTLANDSLFEQYLVHFLFIVTIFWCNLWCFWYNLFLVYQIAEIGNESLSNAIFAMITLVDGNISCN